MKHWICPGEYVNLKPEDNYCRQQDAQNNMQPLIRNLHTLYRKTFVTEHLQETRIRITADDYYMLFVNGSFVAQGPANGYHFVYNINNIDITPFLKTGKNVIAVDTLYNGYRNRAYNSGDNRLGMYAEVLQGSEVLFCTDETWKYIFDHSFLDTDVTYGYCTQTAEYRDMNFYPHGWTNAEYDDSHWAAAVVKTDDDHICVDQMTPNVTSEEVKSRKITWLSSNHFILDFEKELAGQLFLEVQGKKGSKVYTYFGEELNDDGSVRFDMRCNVKYEEYIVLSGRKDLIMNYEYKAFRYVEIRWEEGIVTPEKVSVLKRHYPVEKIAVFHSSEKLLEDIWEICENAVIVSSQEGYLDCPTREKGQYLGDMLVTSLTHSLITGDTRLYRKALLDFAESSRIDQGLLAVVPGNFMQEIADFSLLYPQILWNYYHLTGDEDLARELLPVAEGVAESFEKYAREDGLLEAVTGKWNLVDWPENLRDNYDFALTQPVGEGCHNVINAYYYGALCTLNKLRVSLGYEEKYVTDKLLKAYRKAFYRPEKDLFADSETSVQCNFHSNVLPLYFEMCDSETGENIAEYIMKKGLCCGVFFAYFALKGLAGIGHYGKVYDLITNDSIHSWKNMLKEGATCTFEAWGKEQKWNTSLCHPWGSSPVIVITEDLLGYKFRKGQLCKEEEHLPDGVYASVKGGLLQNEERHTIC